MTMDESAGLKAAQQRSLRIAAEQRVLRLRKAAEEEAARIRAINEAAKQAEREDVGSVAREAKLKVYRHDGMTPAEARAQNIRNKEAQDAATFKKFGRSAEDQRKREAEASLRRRSVIAADQRATYTTDLREQHTGDPLADDSSLFFISPDIRAKGYPYAYPGRLGASYSQFDEQHGPGGISPIQASRDASDPIDRERETKRAADRVQSKAFDIQEENPADTLSTATKREETIPESEIKLREIASSPKIEVSVPKPKIEVSKNVYGDTLPYKPAGIITQPSNVTPINRIWAPYERTLRGKAFGADKIAASEENRVIEVSVPITKVDPAPVLVPPVSLPIPETETKSVPIPRPYPAPVKPSAKIEVGRPLTSARETITERTRKTLADQGKIVIPRPPTVVDPEKLAYYSDPNRALPTVRETPMFSGGGYESPQRETKIGPTSPPMFSGGGEEIPQQDPNYPSELLGPPITPSMPISGGEPIYRGEPGFGSDDGVNRGRRSGAHPDDEDQGITMDAPPIPLGSALELNVEDVGNIIGDTIELESPDLVSPDLINVEPLTDTASDPILIQPLESSEIELFDPQDLTEIVQLEDSLITEDKKIRVGPVQIGSTKSKSLSAGFTAPIINIADTELTTLSAAEVQRLSTPQLTKFVAQLRATNIQNAKIRMLIMVGDQELEERQR
jgi:hypothetical protein